MDPARRPSAAPVVDGYLDLLREEALTPAVPASHRVPLAPRSGEQRRIARLLLGLGPQDVVLDAGCGAGAFVGDFARIAGARGCVVGVDVAPEPLARACAAVPDAAFLRADVRRLPFASETFDAVCCFGVLHLLDDPWRALDELTRVLRRGGRLALMTTCRTRGWQGLLGVGTFGPDDLTSALASRGYSPVRRRVSGVVQFVGGRLR